MGKFTRSRVFTLLLALFFALLLFFNANSDGRPTPLTGEANLAAVAEQVPIRLKYDESKYYVADYDESTTVYLKSFNKVLLDIEANELTRNFKVEADLTKYSDGTYEVPLKVTDMNQAVEATLKDQKIHVRIEKRESRVFPVTAKVNDNLLKSGYSLDNIAITPAEVEITSGRETLEQIAEVVASLDDDRNLSDDLSKRIDVVALDKEGNVLSVIIVPTTVTMSLEINAPSKSVPLVIKQSGSIAEGIKEFKFTTKTETIKISGAREVIDEVKEITLYIDTSGIKESGRATFDLASPEHVTMSPLAVEVAFEAVMSEQKKTSETTKTSKSESQVKDSSNK